MSARFCGRCGTQRISEGDLYCGACGRLYPQPSAPAFPLITRPSTPDTTVALHSANEVLATSSQQLKTRWLDFWTYVHLPLGVVVGLPLALSKAGSAENLFGIIIVEIPIIWLFTATAFGLHKRRLSAWQLNWLCVLGDVIGFSFARVSKAAAAEETATFAAWLLVYGLVWGIPNCIYFKKRRVLFSGPPLVEDGIRGIFKAIWRFIWPSVASLESAMRASREGFYAAAIITLVTLILVSFSALGYPLFGFNLGSLLDASISAAVAWGIYRRSRTASALGILFFIVEQVVSWTARAPGSVPEFIDSALTTSALALMFINGARGTFAYQRHQKAAADKSHEPAATSSVRWKTYSAVLASFVIGVLALRVYQSLISVAPTGNTGGSSEDLTALVKQVRPAVVTIITSNSKGKLIGQGSGFFTSKAGEILTNHHVLEGAYSATVKTNDGETHPIAAVLADDPDSDLTKVMVIVDDDTPFLPLAHQRAEAGQRIVVIGSPKGLEETVSEGIVSALPEERQEIGEIMPATLQITAPISEGSSGGPVVNLRGEVVGVAAAYLSKSENLNFAIPLERVLDLKRIKPVAFDIWSNPSRKPEAKDFFAEGLASMKLEDCEHGLRSFGLALKKRPSFAWAWWGTGICLMQEGKTDEAIACLKKASVLDPSLGPPHYALALAYVGQGKRGAAYQEYEALKGLDPNLAENLARQLPK